MQYRAGYIIDALYTLLKEGCDEDKFSNLLYWNTHFTLNSLSGFEKISIEYPSQIAVLINLLQRGAPTNLNIHALDFLLETSQSIRYSEVNHDNSEIKTEVNSSITADEVFQSLHLIDPRISPSQLKKAYKKSWENLDSKFEEDFYFKLISENKNFSGLPQILESQRSIKSIIEDKISFKSLPSNLKQNFKDQKTDFSIEFPYTMSREKGIVIEIDGSQHLMEAQASLDQARDRAIQKSGWAYTVRLPTNDFDTHRVHEKIENGILQALEDQEYVQRCMGNYLEALYQNPKSFEILQLYLIPLAIARIQRTLLEVYTKSEKLRHKKKWDIAIIERDVPCGCIAIQDLLKVVNAINALSNTQLELPEFNVVIFSSDEFIKSKYHLIEPKSCGQFNPGDYYDLVMDVAIMDRTMATITQAANAIEVVNIRSVHHLEYQHKVETNALVEYKPFCALSNNSDKWEEIDKEAIAGLEYILKCIFRKTKFRPGQLPILNNALQSKSVIGLLPTGGGKSLTYQLAAFLQPGICIIIDPIKSLMRDQVRGLKNHLIDTCTFINSSLSAEVKRASQRKIESGGAHFLFITPERLQMKEFRSVLTNLYEDKKFFSYCVIDEAHCVSEWGHDFRPSYLRLGINAMRFCKTKDRKYLPLFGLTATASYDVLADIQRELSGDEEDNRLKEDAIVKAEYLKRDELQYYIYERNLDAKVYENFWDLRRDIGNLKKESTKQLINDMASYLHNFKSDPLSVFSKENYDRDENHKKFKEIGEIKINPHHLFQGDKHAGLIFCPHRSGHYGVTDKFKPANPNPPTGVYDSLSIIPEIKAGFFMGGGDNGAGIENDASDNQDEFMAGDTNLMVATKAFGMGIDKSNIRFTIHINYPPSLESFVQEAGRAGRDGKMAAAFVLFNRQTFQVKEKVIDHDYDINKYFHDNSFKGDQKELDVLDELLTEIYFPDKTLDIQALIAEELNAEVNLSLWERDALKRLYVNRNFDEPLGYFDLSKNKGFTKFEKKGIPIESVDPILSESIWEVIQDFLKKKDDGLLPVIDWLKKLKKDPGLENLLNKKEGTEPFKLTVGFTNDLTNRVEKIAASLRSFVHANFTAKEVDKLITYSTKTVDFIAAVEEKYNQWTGNRLDFNKKCLDRDLQKKLERGTTFNKFMKYFNGYRDKADTEKAIYRLTTLGVIDDYTVDFRTHTFDLYGRKKTKPEYIQHLRTYLSRYYAPSTVEQKIKDIDDIQGHTFIRQGLHFLVNFAYKEIQEKRARAIHDMREACIIGLEDTKDGVHKNVKLKEHIDLYFNSKYARSNYTFETDSGDIVDGSLYDMIKKDSMEPLALVLFFVEAVELDRSGTYNDNLKHLRGACLRLLNPYPNHPDLLLLNAFTLYMLELTNPRYRQEAEEMYLKAFSILLDQIKSEDEIIVLFEKYITLIRQKKSEISSYLETGAIRFSLEPILLGKWLEPLKIANQTLESINQTLY